MSGHRSNFSTLLVKYFFVANMSWGGSLRACGVVCVFVCVCDSVGSYPYKLCYKSVIQVNIDHHSACCLL